MRIGIFTGGEHAKTKTVKRFLKNRKLDYVIAADSGLEQADKLGITPNFILGDFDSLQQKSLLQKYDNVPSKYFAQDKDFTDTELALQQADLLLKNKLDEIIIFGAGGDERVDHLIYFLRVFKTPVPPSIWFYNTGVGFCISSELKNHLKIELSEGTTISVFNINTNFVNAKPKIISAGLFWELENLDWKTLASISNRNKYQKPSFTAKSGRFLILINSHNLQIKTFA